MYNYKPKLAEVDPDNPNMFVRCDRCGFISNASKMVWQFDYRGTPNPINTRILTCGRPSCLDVPQVQNSPIILSPDPEPVFNARPFPYGASEASWLGTQDGYVIDTQSGDDITAAIPNPDGVADASYISAPAIDAGGSDLSVLYLDLFNGSPVASGRSVLAAITGSATRTDIAADITTTEDTATNTDVITIAAESASVTNVNWLGFYSAASGGTLLFYAPVTVNDHGNSIGVGTLVAIAALGLTFIEVGGLDMTTEAGAFMASEAGQMMVTE